MGEGSAAAGAGAMLGLLLLLAREARAAPPWCAYRPQSLAAASAAMLPLLLFALVRDARGACAYRPPASPASTGTAPVASGSSEGGFPASVAEAARDIEPRRAIESRSGEILGGSEGAYCCLLESLPAPPPPRAMDDMRLGRESLRVKDTWSGARTLRELLKDLRPA